MIKIDEETKALLAKYVGPDGKLIIDESLPDDIKESFQFFNDEGVNILDFATNNTLHLHATEEPDPDSVEEIEWDEENVTSLEDGQVASETPSVPPTPEPLSEKKLAEVNKNLNDLNDMF